MHAQTECFVELIEAGEHLTTIANCAATGKTVGVQGDRSTWGEMARSFIFHAGTSRQICEVCSSMARRITSEHMRETCDVT